MIRSRILRNCVVVAVVAALFAGGAFAQERGRRGGGGRALRMVPAESLVCIAIRDLDSGPGGVNEFLKGMAPDEFDAKTHIVSLLESQIGKGQIENVRTDRQIILFAVNLPSAGNPMGNMFLGLLLPVRNYDAFVSENPYCGQPDANGISRITIDGKDRCLVVSSGRRALLCQPNNYDKLIRARDMISARGAGLTEVLSEDEIELAQNAPFWVYASVKRASQMLSPMVSMGLMQMKAAIEQAQQKQQGPAGNAEAIVNFYGGLFKFLLSETDHISLAVSAGAEKCEVALVISAVPGTDMAKMLGTSEGSAGDYKGMLGYLDNGAIINLATIIDHEAMKTMYSGMFDLFGAMGGETMGEADAAKLKESTVRMVDSLGDSLAFSFTVGDGGTGPFSMREVVSVKDEKLFREVLEEQIEMMNEGAFKNLYKSFGMDMDMKVKRATGTYKGVSIDSATVTFSMGDENSPQSEMVRKMWGDGIQYRWALLDGYCVYAVGSKVDEAIRELIDQVRAGGPGEVKSEMKAALEAIGDSDEADTVGTVNIARMIKMGLGIMPIPAEAAAKIEIQSKSNIVFAGKGGVLRMVVPKEHLLELKSAIETMGKQAKQQGQ